MNTHFSKLIAIGSLLALLGAGCTGSEPAVETKPIAPPTTKVDTKPADTTPTPTPDTAMIPDREVDTKELPVIDGTWKTYSNTSFKFSFQYPTRGRYAPEWNVSIMRADDARLEGNCLKPEATVRTINTSLVVGDSTFCIMRTVDAGAGQRYYTDAFTAPLGDRIVLITFNKRLANGDLFEDESCHGKTVISSGTSCIPFDEALYRAHLNQIVSTYRHE